MSLGESQEDETPMASLSMSGASVGVTFIHGSEERERDALPGGSEGPSRPTGRSTSTPSDEVGGYDHGPNEAEGFIERLDKMDGRALLLHLKAQGIR
jgi:hypothetical protein